MTQRLMQWVLSDSTHLLVIVILLLLMFIMGAAAIAIIVWNKAKTAGGSSKDQQTGQQASPPANAGGGTAKPSWTYKQWFRFTVGLTFLVLMVGSAINFMVTYPPAEWLDRLTTGKLIWIIAFGTALFLLWYLSGKSRNIFVAALGAAVALVAGAYVAVLAENGFDRYKVWPFAKQEQGAEGQRNTPGGAPSPTRRAQGIDSITVADVPSPLCNQGRRTVLLAPGKEMANDNACALGFDVQENKNGTTGTVRVFYSDRPSKEWTFGTPPCDPKVEKCGSGYINRIVNEKTIPVTLTIVACPQQMLDPKRGLCKT